MRMAIEMAKMPPTVPPIAGANQRKMISAINLETVRLFDLAEELITEGWTSVGLGLSGLSIKA
jgi:hypothetical protein